MNALITPALVRLDADLGSDKEAVIRALADVVGAGPAITALAVSSLVVTALLAPALTRAQVAARGPAEDVRPARPAPRRGGGLRRRTAAG